MAAVEHQRHISSCAAPEAAWQAWLQAARVSACALPDLLTANARLVVVAPHPDDEVLACAGLMAMHHARGGEVVVVSVSDGEASHGNLPKQQKIGLAATRHLELLQGLHRLGLEQVVVHRLALPDGAIARHAAQLELALIRLLRPGDVVVTTWRLDGHPDHEATGSAAANACAKRGCRLLEAPVWMWHWAEVNDPLVPWQQLRGIALASDVVEAKQAALKAHVSQLDASGRAAGAVLDAAIVARAGRVSEYFFCTAAG